MLRYGEYDCYTYIIFSYAEGDDIGNVYCELSDKEKREIAKEVVEIQNRVSRLKANAPLGWNWNLYIDEMIDRAYERISIYNYFELSKVAEVRHLKNKMQDYFDTIKPIPYLDDISTKNLLIDHGKLSSVIDIDWMGFGDILTFVAMTQVALLSMDYDLKYVDYLLEELHPSKVQYKAFVFYCLLFCVDFMGERGMQFLDKVIPVNQEIINRFNNIYIELMDQWKRIN